MTKNKIFSFFAILLFTTAPLPATLDSPQLEELDAMVSQALEAFHVPGAAVSIIIDGKTALTKGYGFRDLDQRLPVTENTLFAIGSCTKAFTTYVLGQLVEEGKLCWDDLVIDYIPEFRLKDPYTTYHLTIRDLASHQSGLARHDLLWWFNPTISRQDLLPRLQYLDSAVPFRERFHYNNLMYIVAGFVIERITGQTWEEAVRSRIFVPLGMNRSNFSVLDSQKSDDFSLPFKETDGITQPIAFNPTVTTAGPAGSINSSAVDMAKWHELQLSDGTFEGQSLIKKETLQAMHTPQVALQRFPEKSPAFLGYGLGWVIGIHEGHYLIAHDGRVDGFISSALLLPKERIGVVVLTNSDSGSTLADGLSLAILNQILGNPQERWISKAKERAERLKLEKQKQEESPSLPETIRPLNDYVGEFEHPAYGKVQVKSEEGRLHLFYGGLSIVLTHKSYDHFVGVAKQMPDSPFRCFFIADSSGAICQFYAFLDPAAKAVVFEKK
jgi:CubicO group peptidase (beta-lactamase class C family)